MEKRDTDQKKRKRLETNLLNNLKKSYLIQDFQTKFVDHQFERLSSVDRDYLVKPKYNIKGITK